MDRKGTPTRRQPVRCLCTPHRQTLFGEGRRGVQPRLFCILGQGVWGLGVCWEISSVLNSCRDQARRHVPDRPFIAKIEMATRYRGVGGDFPSARAWAPRWGAWDTRRGLSVQAYTFTEACSPPPSAAGALGSGFGLVQQLCKLRGPERRAGAPEPRGEVWTQALPRVSGAPARGSKLTPPRGMQPATPLRPWSASSCRWQTRRCRYAHSACWEAPDRRRSRSPRYQNLASLRVSGLFNVNDLLEFESASQHTEDILVLI